MRGVLDSFVQLLIVAGVFGVFVAAVYAVMCLLGDTTDWLRGRV